MYPSDFSNLSPYQRILASGIMHGHCRFGTRAPRVPLCGRSACYGWLAHLPRPLSFSLPYAPSRLPTPPPAAPGSSAAGQGDLDEPDLDAFDYREQLEAINVARSVRKAALIQQLQDRAKRVGLQYDQPPVRTEKLKRRRGPRPSAKRRASTSTVHPETSHKSAAPRVLSAEQKAARRRQVEARRSRHRTAEREVRRDPALYWIPPHVLEKYPVPEVRKINCDSDESLSHSTTAWTGAPAKYDSFYPPFQPGVFHGARLPWIKGYRWSLKELLEQGFSLHPWSGT
jgi:hypothetical protein